MRRKDIFFAVICGISVAWVISDFYAPKFLLLYLVLPIFSVLCLWLAEFASKRLPFVLQAAKFALVGGFADILDIKAFQLLILLIPADLFIKSISFLIAVAIKYIGNKYWVFDKLEKDSIKEIVQFLIITLGGLLINVASFYCATKIIGVHFGFSEHLWTELSIIFAALAAAVWNFLGYKFLVFKK